MDWYTDVMEILKLDDIDALSICTPTTTHADIAIAAITSGKHVLVEKRAYHADRNRYETVV